MEGSVAAAMQAKGKVRTAAQVASITSIASMPHATLSDCMCIMASVVHRASWSQVTPTPVEVSQQNLLDCSWTFGNSACAGGLDYEGFEWMLQVDDDDGLLPNFRKCCQL